jgi:CubicO group peptidase (beta-lactamase class C family)
MIALLTALLLAQAPSQPQTAQPQKAEAQSTAWRAAAAYSDQYGGLALVVRRGPEILFEHYADGHGPDKPWMLASGSVGLCTLAALCAEEDGLLKLDERVSDTLAEWRGVAGKDAVTVRQLLALESGIAANNAKVRDTHTLDHYQAALEAPMVDLPGQSFRFGPTAWFVLGALLDRKLAGEGGDVLAYLRKRLLDPLGVDVHYWDRDKAGRPLLPTGAYLTAREWSKVGTLIVERGRAGERQLLSAERIALLAQPSRLEPNYGLGFWLHGGLDGARSVEGPQPGAELTGAERVEERAASIPRDLLFSAGFGRQRMFVFPSQGLVVVRQGYPVDGWSDVDFLRILLGIDTAPR